MGDLEGHTPLSDQTCMLECEGTHSLLRQLEVKDFIHREKIGLIGRIKSKLIKRNRNIYLGKSSGIGKWYTMYPLIQLPRFG